MQLLESLIKANVTQVSDVAHGPLVWINCMNSMFKYFTRLSDMESNKKFLSNLNLKSLCEIFKDVKFSFC